MPFTNRSLAEILVTGSEKVTVICVNVPIVAAAGGDADWMIGGGESAASAFRGQKASRDRYSRARGAFIANSLYCAHLAGSCNDRQTSDSAWSSPAAFLAF